eukprot:sb/3474317/
MCEDGNNLKLSQEKQFSLTLYSPFILSLFLFPISPSLPISPISSPSLSPYSPLSHSSSSLLPTLSFQFLPSLPLSCSVCCILTGDNDALMRAHSHYVSHILTGYSYREHEGYSSTIHHSPETTTHSWGPTVTILPIFNL